MLKRTLLAVVGAAMGGLCGLLAAGFGLGAYALLGGAVLGALIFFFGIPILLDRSD